MKINVWSKRIGAASLASAMLFTGNALVDKDTEAAEPPLAVVETTAATEVTVPRVDPYAAERAVCEEIAAQADGTHIFVYDAEELEMVYCGTDPLDKLYPASITKVYAALVALMYLEPDQVVTAGDPGVPGWYRHGWGEYGHSVGSK